MLKNQYPHQVSQMGIENVNNSFRYEIDSWTEFPIFLFE